jgi:hypothetical protein
MAKYINQKRIKGLILKEEDKVYLFNKTLKPSNIATSLTIRNSDYLESYRNS